MSSPKALPNAGQILASGSFWNKVADVDYSQMDEERAGRIFTSFVDTMKTAGFSPLNTFGVILGFADLAGSQKSASIAMVKLADPLEVAGPLTSSPAPKVPATGNPEGAGTWDKIMGWLGNNAAGQRFILDTAAKEYPTLHSMASGLFGDNPDALAKFYADVSGAVPGHERNVMGAATSAWDALKSKPFVKEWAPAVIPGLATMAASRMAGAGWGTSALLGVGAGALHAKATQVGGYAPLYNSVVHGIPHMGQRPTSGAGMSSGARPDEQGLGTPTPNAAPVNIQPTPAAQATSPVVPAAQQTIQQNAANADRISSIKTD
jgi:hypothetical protein